MKCAELVKG